MHVDVEDRVFDAIARLSRRLLVTVEDEATRGGRHFPRDYRAVFESRGLRQVHSQPTPEMPSFVTRVFAPGLIAHR